MDFSNISIITQPRVSSDWTKADYAGALKVRLSIGRNKYNIQPGLYKLGKPDKTHEVIVTSNYKLSFDIVRRSLQGLNAWILVLQTQGINVWCAAGKGTFGSDELIKQINDSELNSHVSHKRVIVPQLGAPGISGYKVKDATGFTVKFGPVRAENIKMYLSNGLKKDDVMRAVQFNFKDRLILAPVELTNSLRYLLYAIIVIVLLSSISPNEYTVSTLWTESAPAILLLLLAYFSGAFITPVLLPWIPFRHFGAKGLLVGFTMFGLVAFLNYPEYSIKYIIGWLLLSGAISSYLGMNFTGASTYTSLSGVIKEMRYFVPLQILLTLVGLVFIILSKF